MKWTMPTTKTESKSNPVAAENRRAMKRAEGDPAASFAAMLTPAAWRAVCAAAEVFDAKGKREAADRLLTVPYDFDTAEGRIALHAEGGLSERAADSWRLSMLRRANEIPAGGGLTALAVGMAAGWTRATPAEPFRPVSVASLPRLHRITDAPALAAVPDTLPQFRDGDTASLQAALPGFESSGPGCPSWLLWAYDRAGGRSMAQGRGAPWSLRLFVAALLHLAVADRDGEWHTLRFPVGEVERWLHPGPGGWRNRKRDWKSLPAALEAMADLAYVPVPGLGSVMTLAPSIIPREPTDPLVEFTARIPRPAAAGARLDWPRLCRYGADSAALYRAYLSVAAAMDRAAYRGAPVTRQIGAPVLDASGRPRRTRGGRVRRRADALVAHPFAALAPRWSDSDAARFVGFDPTQRYARMRARQALERLAADAVIDVRRTARGTFELYAPPRAPDAS